MPSVGAPVFGKAFFNRERELNEILDSIGRDNILLVSPRRFGKSSLMRQVEIELGRNETPCLYFDVMDIKSPEKFIIEIADASFTKFGMSNRQKLIRALKTVFSAVDEISGSTGGTELRVKLRGVVSDEINRDNWANKGEEILKAVIQVCEKRPVVFLIDELSECVNNMIKEKADSVGFLQWFRNIRQEMIDEVRFIVGGSISFERVVKGINGLSYINDFKHVIVEGFTKEVSLEFLKKCLAEEGIEYNKKIDEEILECIGEPYIPYFLAVFISILAQRPDKVLNVKIIEQIYNNEVLGVYGKGYFEYYRQRLRTYPEPIAIAAEEILRKVCLVDKGYPLGLAFSLFTRKSSINDFERFLDLIHDLENDFYIVVYNRKIFFRSKMLRDWWRLYYG